MAIAILETIHQILVTMHFLRIITLIYRNNQSILAIIQSSTAHPREWYTLDLFALN